MKKININTYRDYHTIVNLKYHFMELQVYKTSVHASQIPDRSFKQCTQTVINNEIIF